jgi:hypothetical protein
MTEDTNTGGPRPSAKIVNLEEERKAAELRRRRSKDRVGELVKDLNKQFCVVPEGSDIFVYREQRDPLRKGHWRLNKFTFKAFRELLFNHRMAIDVPDPKKPGMTKQIITTHAEIWLAHQDRRECKGGPLFDPTGKVSSSHWWNIWKGFAVKPVKNRLFAVQSG